MNENDKTYQLTCLFSPLSTTEELNKIVQKIKDGITTQGGSFVGEEISTANLVKKRLAYPINKHQEAFFLNINFVYPIKLISEFKDKFLSEGNIIRFLIAIKEKEKKQSEKKAKDSFNFELVDKVEPLSEKKNAMVEKITPETEIKEPVAKEAVPEKDISTEKVVKEKVKIEELDKKLEEILNQ